MVHTLIPETLPAADVDDVARVLTPEGERIPDRLLDPWITDVNTGALRALHRDMSVLRRLDAEGVALQRQGQLGLWAPCAGQEATQIGIARAFRDDDFHFTSYRELGVLYARGVSPEGLVRQWRGEAPSGYDPFDVHVAPLQIIIGAQSLHAVGYAMGVQRDGGDQVAAAWFGDGATSEGDVSEALVWAASFDAPVVFVCTNNQYAISEPVGVQTRHSIATRAAGFGVPSLRVDGNDVLACLAAGRWAAHHARSGEGPAFIEAVTYRMGPHTTSDDPTRYRTADEREAWARRDPIDRVAEHLEGLGAMDDAFAAEVAVASDQAAADMRAACLAMTTAPALSVFDHVYAEPHAALAAQRGRFAAYLDGFEGAETEAAR